MLETVLITYITYVIVILTSRDRTHAVNWTVILFVILSLASEDSGHSGRILKVASPDSGIFWRIYTCDPSHGVVMHSKQAPYLKLWLGLQP